MNSLWESEEVWDPDTNCYSTCPGSDRGVPSPDGGRVLRLSFVTP